MARVRDKAKIFGDKKKILDQDLQILSTAEESTSKEVVDMILDPDMEMRPHALAYALKTFKIPRSYFLNASDNHKREILRHALNLSDADLAFAVAKTDARIESIGPQKAIEPFRELIGYLDGFGGRLSHIQGSFLTEGRVKLFQEFTEFEEGTKYKIGMSILMSPLCGRGIRMDPTIFEVRCTNGLADIISSVEVLRIKANEISIAALTDGRAAAVAVLGERTGFYKSFMNTLSERKMPDPLTVLKEMEYRRFPTSYMDKVTPLLNAVVSQASELSDELPEKIENARELLSVLTFAAREFNPETRNRIEGGLMQYAQQWALAA